MWVLQLRTSSDPCMVLLTPAIATTARCYQLLQQTPVCGSINSHTPTIVVDTMPPAAPRVRLVCGSGPPRFMRHVCGSGLILCLALIRRGRQLGLYLKRLEAVRGSSASADAEPALAGRFGLLHRVRVVVVWVALYDSSG